MEGGNGKAEDVVKSLNFRSFRRVFAFPTP